MTDSVLEVHPQSREGTGLIQKGGSLPTPEELELIHRFTRRPLEPQELYVFTVQLCDNQVDRDHERFTAKALERLAPLFVGRTGIFDHQNRGENQVARIFSAWVERPPAPEGTLPEEGYCRLVGRAYLLRHERNQPLMLAIDGGIQKEVSVSCAVGSKRCSICGREQLGPGAGCDHQKGRWYDGRQCCWLLDDPTDAYEFSFVAVPAQREAGVLKGFSPQGDPLSGGLTLDRWLDLSLGEGTEVEKGLLNGAAPSLAPDQRQALRKEYDELKRWAQAGLEYRQQLRAQVLGASALCGFPMERQVLAQAMKGMDLEQLRAFYQGFAQWAAESGSGGIDPAQLLAGSGSEGGDGCSTGQGEDRFFRI